MLAQQVSLGLAPQRESCSWGPRPGEMASIRAKWPHKPRGGMQSSEGLRLCWGASLLYPSPHLPESRHPVGRPCNSVTCTEQSQTCFLAQCMGGFT